MSRPLRIEYRGAVHHSMNRGSARRKVFLSRADYRARRLEGRAMDAGETV